MTAERRPVAREIYLTARSLPTAERAEYVDRKCEGDAGLREEVQLLFDSGNPPPTNAVSEIDLLTRDLEKLDDLAAVAQEACSSTAESLPAWASSG